MLEFIIDNRTKKYVLKDDPVHLRFLYRFKYPESNPQKDAEKCEFPGCFDMMCLKKSS